MKILITGGGGYIGNVLTEVLVNEKGERTFPCLFDKYQVTVFDNLIHRNASIMQHSWRDNFKFVYGDVRNQSLYKKLISENDIIINLAAYVGMPLCNRFPNETKQVNYESVKFLADNISNQQVVLFTMTNSGYGLGQHVDGKAVYCTEETPIKPISLYGETKCDAEKALLDTQKAISLRLATVFGVSPKMRMDLIVNDFVWRAWNDRFIVLFESHFLRNFVHIRDVANTMLFCINNYKNYNMLGQAYNVGNSSANMNKMELCLSIKKQVPEFCIVESPINKDPDQRNYIVSNDKLENLGWGCHFSLSNGIEEVLTACPIIKNANVSFSDI